TPAPRNWPSAQPEEEEDVEDLPTKPMAATFAGPRSPIPAVAQQPLQSQERPAQSNHPLAASDSFAQRPPVPNPNSQPGGPGPFGPPAGNPLSQPGLGGQGPFGQP